MARSANLVGEYVGIGRQRIRVAVQGSGRPLLLINGIGANLDMWAPLVPALDAETIVYDAPGTGGSALPKLPLSVPQMAKLALRLLDTLGFQEVDVLGVSLGGVVAQQLALSAPKRVRRLVLASTTFGVGAVPGKFRAWATLLSPARYYVPGHYERHAPDFLGGRTGREPDLARSYGQVRRAQPPHVVGHAWQLLGGATWSTLPLLHRIRAQTLVLTGDDDPLVPPANARILNWRIPNSELKVFPGGGHLVIFDSVDEVAPVLNEFLQRP
jgi:poly(3-hydroxyalkanoate) depolymerase